MGTWGLHFDENDDAADWLGDLADEPDWQAVDQALAVTDADYLDSGDASNALAAAEIVAAGIGKASPRLEQDLVDWAADQPAEARERRQDAILALRRVCEDSELQELWQESGELGKWQALVDETLARL